MSDRRSRLGKIIKIIANKPSITLGGLLSELAASGIQITERTLAKDVLLLKTDYGLLPNHERLRSGYVLDGMCTLAETEISLVLDAMHVFGVRLNDPEAATMKERLVKILREQNPQALAAGLETRTVRQRDIFEKNKGQHQTQNTLLAAIRARKAVAMEYLTPRVGQPKRIDGYPLLMVFHERGWYCIVKDMDRAHYYPRRIDRIRTCAINTKSPANARHADDIKQAQFLISCGWGMTFPQSLKELANAENQPEIVVRFDNSIAPFILESVDRHPRGKIRRARDGSQDVEFRIKLSNPEEFRYWVRSFGAKAWFVAPQSLVDSERAEIRRMLSRYRD